MKKKNVEITSQNITFEQYDILKNVENVKEDLERKHATSVLGYGFLGAIFGGLIGIIANLNIIKIIITVVSLGLGFGFGLTWIVLLILNYDVLKLMKYYKQVKKANELDKLNEILAEYEKSDRFEKDKLEYEISILESEIQEAKFATNILEISEKIAKRKNRLQEIEDAETKTSITNINNKIKVINEEKNGTQQLPQEEGVALITNLIEKNKKLTIIVDDGQEDTTIKPEKLERQDVEQTALDENLA